MRPRLAMLSVVACALCASALTAEITAIENVRLFDGETVRENATIVFDTHVIAVGTSADIEIPGGAKRVDGKGKTVLPGLIDAHTHVFGAVLADALNFGVTSCLDMFTHPQMAKGMRAQQKDGGPANRADLFSAGFLVTATGGHGTQFGLEVPTLDDPEEAEEFVAARVAEGSDYIKLIYEGGENIGRPLPTLSYEALEKAIAAAHAHGKLAVVHVSTLERAKEAVAAGADGLVHIFYDQETDDAFVEAARERGIFIVPTLAITESVLGNGEGKKLAEDEAIAAHATREQILNLGRSFPAREGFSIDAVLASVGRLDEAGIPMLAGTDAPNPGTAFGISMHRDLELLVEAGVAPIAALRGATAQTAAAFQLEDRGTLVPGKLAHVVLVDGDPTTDIKRTRNIAGIWKGGERFEREVAEPQTEHPSHAAGLVTDFESDEAGESPEAASWGGTWTVSTDKMMGGGSTGTMHIVTENGNNVLEVSGEMKPGAPNMWSGPMLGAAAQMMTRRSLEGDRFRIRLKGEEAGQVYLYVFAESLGFMPSIHPVSVTTDWTIVEVPFDDFSGFDASGFQAILFSGPPQEGTFRFWMDDFEVVAD